MPDTRPLPGFYNDLDETMAEAWRLLSRAVSDRRSPLHTPGIATIGLEGGPRLRTVVLRACDPAARQLRFHTDARAAKVAELARDPRIALHGYDAGAKVQLRLEGVASLHAEDAIADAAWANSLAMSRACYSITPGPGTAIMQPDHYSMPTESDVAAEGRKDFRAVIITVTRLEWLYLARQGHRRAVFDLVAGEAGWLAP
jgi:pyridoxamine 5'-phosphate oxidase